MNRELKLFLLTVGIPAIVLMIAGARLIYAEWRFDTREEARMSQLDDMPPPESDDGYPPKPDEFDPGDGLHELDEINPREHRELEPLEPRELGPDDRREPPPPKPLPLYRLFSEEYGMNGSRELTIFGCLIGLMFLSLVSGSCLLMRAARKARMEALQETDFVSNISHEFKTPLTTICLCAELAQDEGMDPSRRQKALTSIMVESERLKRLVMNALDFSRLEKQRYHYNIENIDVSEIARETCAALVPRFGEGKLNAPEGNLNANADAEAVRQILANLLDNAAKYAPNGTVEVSVVRQGDRVKLSVADHGPGLNSDEVKHVFNRFWRGDNSVTRTTGGSGLGLAIARGLARGMGGDLTAANRDGGGAVFTLELNA